MVNEPKRARAAKPATGSDSDEKRIDVKSLQEQPDKLSALTLEATSDGTWAWHIPSGEAYFSPRYYTMLGYDPDELPANYDTWANLLHPDDLEPTQAFIRQHIENKDEGYDVEFRLRTKAGGWLWILGRGKVIERDREGHPILMVGSHINIDSRKRAEEKLARYQTELEDMVRERTRALEQTTSLLEATLNAIPDVLGIQDNQHRIIRYNAAGYQFLNMAPEEVVGKRCFELIGRNQECEHCATSECYRTKRPTSVKRYEAALDAWLDVRAYPILDEYGKLIKVIEHLRDITPEKKAEAENRKLQEQLIHAQKMESLGTLAGGIAHDFNNLLMGIQGRASLMSIDLANAHPHREHVTAIEEYVRSATDLTKQLLGIARGGKYEVKPVDINEIVVGSVNMFARTRKELEIHTRIHDHTLVVAADRGQIEQVLLNMYVNAWQAMPNRGELHLETQPVEMNTIQSRAHQIKPGRYGRIAIRDTGVGMDASTRQQIFDPFFTTKEKGRGTGLGLASAYGIVKNHGGAITVESEPGQGTVFTIFLPLTLEAVQAGASRETGLVAGQETVLLVDDEQMILDVGQAMLEKLGYGVLIARGGEEAMAILEDAGDDIDLVILDLIMPGIDGDQVFDHILSHRPHLPVLLSSGYAINGQAEALLHKGCQGFIQKPFNMSALSEYVRKILDTARK
ncbi:MAG: PAS domain-containing protein [Desulfobacterales bacterium]|nr:PAS domain-containing protein [Desulfobacterales bacterium]